ncbi:hypothetical protein [Salinibius halmophilus]|uniref:hypothetical protein n=1 Tax=Salinibius halmophilus TaxID=1853216 RepID=UPI000E65FC61|nr:hypothetical protein [Salinibius halmophilus]
MGVFEMVVLIVAIAVGAGVAETWMKTRSKQQKGKVDEALEAKVQALEDRVQVLEELVTDGKHRLRAEFDALK